MGRDSGAKMMKGFFCKTGIFLLLVLSMSMIVVSSVHLYTMNQAEQELYELKLKESEKKESEKSLKEKTEVRFSDEEARDEEVREEKSGRSQEEARQIEESFSVDVPEVLQYPLLPQGCETAALTSLLNHYGYEVDMRKLAEEHLPKADFTKKNGRNYGPDPDEAYAGDPSKISGWYCNAKPIAEAANSFFQEEKIFDRAVDISGISREKLIDEVQKGNPVLVWTTVDLAPVKRVAGWYEEKTGKRMEVPVNSHCVLLNGFEGKRLFVMDPLRGQQTVEAELFFESYYELGGYAVKLERN